MTSRPTNAVAAIALSLLPLPAMKALDQANSGCGDGMCGFFSGILILGALAAVTLAFIGRSAKRSEAPAFLRWVPLLMWAIALVPLTL